jgi:hypothetical protein
VTVRPDSRSRPEVSAPRPPGQGPAAAAVRHLKGSTGFDISQYQCGNIPSARAAIAIVQVTGGALNNPPNPCYAREAVWAGAHLSVYIYLNGLPNPAPRESLIGPASRCARVSPVCQAYDFGFNWARHWVAHSRRLGINPKLWWLDVETGSGWTTPAVNDGVIRGAADAVRRERLDVGIYSTPYQWAAIAGALTFPGVPVWTAGAGNLTGPGYTATAYCRSGGNTFAGGHLTLVQWGYKGAFPGAFQGNSPYDQDYACDVRDERGR